MCPAVSWSRASTAAARRRTVCSSERLRSSTARLSSAVRFRMRAGVVEAGVTQKMNRCPEAAQPAPIGGAASLERGTLRRTSRSLSPKVDHLARDACSVTRGKQLEEDLVAPGLEDGDRDVCAALVRRARRRLERSSRQVAEVRDGREDPIRIDSEERPADAEALARVPVRLDRVCQIEVEP